MIEMSRALAFSLVLHLFLCAGLFWSAQISFALMQQKIKELNDIGVRKAEDLYKPTEVNIRFGEVRRDLPPPKIKTAPAVPKDIPTYTPTRTPPPKAARPSPAKEQKPDPQKQIEEKRSEALALIDRFRQQEGLEAKEKPREDNFPTRLDGERGARGTGGSAELQATAAQLALQAAMRRHFQLPQAATMRRQHPDAKGYLSVSLIGAGTSLRLESIQVIQPSGFQVLDVSCERAVRTALNEEIFAQDVVKELSRQETMITCQF